MILKFVILRMLLLLFWLTLNWNQEARKKGFVVVIVPSSASRRTYLNFAEYDSAIDDDSKLWRLHNIIMPLISLSSFCKGTYVLPRRNDVFRFVKNRDVYPISDGFNLRASDVGELIYHKLHRR